MGLSIVFLLIEKIIEIPRNLAPFPLFATLFPCSYISPASILRLILLPTCLPICSHPRLAICDSTTWRYICAQQVIFIIFNRRRKFDLLQVARAGPWSNFAPRHQSSFRGTLRFSLLSGRDFTVRCEVSQVVPGRTMERLPQPRPFAIQTACPVLLGVSPAKELYHVQFLRLVVQPSVAH